MARTICFAAGLGVLVAWNWGRLEQPRPSFGSLALMVLLGIAPALLPTKRWRLAGAVAALFVAAPIALDVSRPYALGRLSSRAGRGFLDFYDVLVPFDGAAHPLMHGVLLLAVFIFTALGALAVASRRPLAASAILVAGAGWPATIFPGSDDLARGALLLVAALALVAWLRPGSRRAPPQILVGTGLVDPCPDRLELRSSRQEPVPQLAGLEPVRKGGEARERGVRVAIGLQRHPLAAQAHPRLHGSRACALCLLARDDARRIRPRQVGRGPVRDQLGGASEPRRSLAGSAASSERTRPKALEPRRRDDRCASRHAPHRAGAARPVRLRIGQRSPVPAGRSGSSLPPGDARSRVHGLGLHRSADAAGARELHCRLPARDHLRQPLSRRRPHRCSSIRYPRAGRLGSRLLRKRRRRRALPASL